MRIAFKDLVLPSNDFCCLYFKTLLPKLIVYCSARIGVGVCVDEIWCTLQSCKVQLWHFQLHSTASFILNEI